MSGTGVVVTTRKLYPFAGQVVAELSGSTLYYLHGDQLGSVALVSGVGSPGSLVSAQDFDPWGAVRTSPAITQTTLNYTGQRLDGTGLLYYHARYYDPVLARWTSPDILVPGMAEGRGGAAATLDYDANMRLMPLTVDFHESTFASALHSENAFTFQKGFWFQLSNQDQQQAKYQWGPANPQALNRYSYVLNNPLRYIDPTGHDYGAIRIHGNIAMTALSGNFNSLVWLTVALIAAGGGAIALLNPAVGLIGGGAAEVLALNSALRAQSLLSTAIAAAGPDGTVDVQYIQGKLWFTAYDANGQVKWQHIYDGPPGTARFIWALFTQIAEQSNEDVNNGRDPDFGPNYVSCTYEGKPCRN